MRLRARQGEESGMQSRHEAGVRPSQPRRGFRAVAAAWKDGRPARRLALLALAAHTLAAGILAAAAEPSLTLDGVWGNEAGCKFAKEGQSEDDSFVVLKTDGLE